MFSRKAATPRKIAGMTVPKTRFCAISSERKRCEIWSLAAVRAEPAVALEQPVEARDHLGLESRPAVRRQRHVVEGALHVEGRAERVAAHPQHAEAPVVGEQARRPGSRRRTRARARCRRCAAAASGRCSTAPRVSPTRESVRAGEGLADQHLVAAARLEPAPAAQVQVVQDRDAPLGDRDQPPGRGLGEARARRASPRRRCASRPPRRPGSPRSARAASPGRASGCANTSAKR